ncbi:MAG: radical SAM protein [Clostridia bacterium]|nr:MAG: radical SAM protein [Clostridia bacterium]
MEIGPIRPPSEAHSLLIRVSRNCTWNKCLFCHTYKDQPFSRRSASEVKADIRQAKEISEHIKRLSWELGYGGKISGDLVVFAGQRYGPEYQQIALWLYKGGTSAFLQDANNLSLPADQLAEIVAFLRETFPSLERVTSYARSASVAKKSLAELRELKEAGLTRIHIGLESGYDPLLTYMRKGVTATAHVVAGLAVKEAGMELSEYVILGLGGREMSAEHALATARVLSEISPHFIRLRTLAINDMMPLAAKVAAGEFTPLGEDEIVREERLLVENLDCQGSHLMSDHSLNLLMEVNGQLPEDKGAMLALIDRYLGLPDEERLIFALGRRTGNYYRLDDMARDLHREQLEAMAARLVARGQVEEALSVMKSRYI